MANKKQVKEAVISEDKEEIKEEEKVETKETKKENIKPDYEEPNYGKTLLAGILIVLILIGGFLSYKKIYDTTEKKDKKDTKIVYTEDEKKFKKEYEDLNGKEYEGTKLKKVSIIEDNNIVYIDLEKAVDLIKNKDGIIYFASPTNDKSRISTPILLNAMESTSLEKIYYLNITKDGEDIRDEYEIVKKKASKVKDADSNYYTLLELLDKNLENYVLINKNGDKVKTGEKRLNIPTVISFNNGKVTGYVEGTIEDHEIDSDGTLRNLTKEEADKLDKKYVDLITAYLDDDCGIEKDEGC